MEKETTIYDLKLHEAIVIETNLGKMEVTRVPGGWVYAFEYPGFRQSPTVFVPFCEQEKNIIRKEKVIKY